jgi:hypothetical protein
METTKQESKMKIVLVDIDGTIANLEHRLELIQGETKDWDSFYDACWDDKPIRPVLEMVDCLEREYHIIFITGRSERVRGATLDWLDIYLRFEVNHDQLLMRKDGDHRPDHIVKPELLFMNNISHGDIAFIIEDRNAVVKKWREMGLTVLQPADGDF